MAVLMQTKSALSALSRSRKFAAKTGLVFSCESVQIHRFSLVLLFSTVLLCTFATSVHKRSIPEFHEKSGLISGFAASFENGRLRVSCELSIRLYRNQWRGRKEHVKQTHAITNSRRENEVGILKMFLRADRMTRVKGYSGRSALYTLFRLHLVHLQDDVFGNLLEIGVQEGLFLCFLASFSRSNEMLVGIDLYEHMQQLNFDRSGGGNLRAVMANLDMIGFPRERFVPVVADSRNVLLSNLESSRLAPFRFASVDGGHSFNNTMHDLILASKLLHEYGVIIVSDVNGLTNGWSGVVDALVLFLNVQRDFVPFLLVANKMYLCSRGYHARLFSMVVNDKTIDCQDFNMTHGSRRSLGGALAGTEFCLSRMAFDDIPSGFEKMVEDTYETS
jgi:Methyltransferase domain